MNDWLLAIIAKLMGRCCKVILAWWYMHSPNRFFFLSLLWMSRCSALFSVSCLPIRFTYSYMTLIHPSQPLHCTSFCVTFIHAFQLFIHYTHSYVIPGALYSLLCHVYLCASLIYRWHSFIYYSCCTVLFSFSRLFIYFTYLYMTLIHSSHSLPCCTFSYVTFIHLLYLLMHCPHI